MRGLFSVLVTLALCLLAGCGGTALTERPLTPSAPVVSGSTPTVALVESVSAQPVPPRALEARPSGAPAVAQIALAGPIDPRGEDAAETAGDGRRADRIGLLVASETAPVRQATRPRRAAAASMTPAARGVPRRPRKGGGVRKVGKPYRIAGRWYHPRADESYDRTGEASWYGRAFHGKKTANGEIFDMDALSAAHPTLPLPSYVEVTNVANGRRVVVRVNDRGPYAHGRIIDLSRATARLLGFASLGTAQVRVRYLRPAPIDGDTQFERAFLARQGWYAAAPTKPSQMLDARASRAASFASRVPGGS
ncbi:MAG: septal ring lytic transglycosylase RlpA family protein [Pseudomonadota bacterium]